MKKNSLNTIVIDFKDDYGQAAYEAGFSEVMYDYIRFPEGFHIYSHDLAYDYCSYPDEGGAKGSRLLMTF